MQHLQDHASESHQHRYADNTECQKPYNHATVNTPALSK